jgi:cytochrome c peroxidase
MTRHEHNALLLALVSVLAGCAAVTSQAPAGRVSELPAVPQPADNLGSPQKIALGKQLFVDGRLSGSGQTACQSCHYRKLGWADAKVLSRKDDGSLNTRHTPSLYNVGYQSAWYWDGRAQRLEAQVLAAWRGQSGADPAKVVSALNTIEGYRVQFRQVYDSEATADNVVKSLAAYLRSKVSDDSPWDRYERGERRAVSRDAVEGFRLFMGQGRCATCHAPPYFGNSTFYNIGLEHGKAKPDPGRFNVTQDEADRGAFKTPSLRSAALSAPYFHDGSAARLEDAVRYMAGGGGSDPNKSALLVPTGLSDAQIRQIVAFIESLTSTEGWEAPQLP